VYKVHEFAELAGVTVRALHHYDRLGLLKPTGRTESGYRLYGDSDLARLEQIVVLKFLGLPLKEIRELLTRESDLRDSLRRQQTVLAEKRGQLDAAIGAIQKAEQWLERKREPGWSLFTKIIKEIEMQNDTDWSKQYYSEEAKTAVEERKALWSPELQERVSRDWAQLFADVEAAIGDGADPVSPQAQDLAARWKKLVGEFTGGNPEIQKGLNKMYSDQDNWPEKQKQNWQIKPEIMTFIMAAMKAK
jgi:MerR family transcriptional regulator, thiopeptide resistance regulator